MTTASPSMPQAARERSGWQHLWLPFGLSWSALGLAGIFVLAAALRFGNIGAIGQANTYYTAAIEAMLQSWHNFFFVAAEPGGSVSVDKPPVGLWLQAISAYFLGVNGFAVVLPQILAGLASVVLVFHLVRRSFGNLAGLIAAFTLAVTPVAIAVERNNTPDATLIFTLLLAAWAFIKATETKKFRFLVLGALLVGVGFNIKMMQALLPLPAFYALYLFGSEQRWWKKIIHLVGTTLVLIPVALSWALIVDLTPADQRPYVGSSDNNSVLNLMFGYNGIERLAGRNSNGGQPSTTSGTMPTPPNAVEGTNQNGAFPQNGSGRGPDGGNNGGMFNTGEAGPLRLFQSGLAAQVSWLLPFGLLSIVALAVSMRWWKPYTERHRGLILWGGWLLTCVAFFSVAGFFHQYYLAMLGPPLAAVVAMSAVWLWQLRSARPINAFVLMLVATLATLAFQIYAVNMYGALNWWVVVPAVLGVIGLLGMALSFRRNHGLLPRATFALVIVSLLIIPSVWSGLTTAYANTSSGLTQAYSGTSNIGRGGMSQRDGQRTPPTAGTAPQAIDGAGMGGARGMGGGVNQSLLDYLEANTQNMKYMLVVPNSNVGAHYVLATGRPVLYAGGFSGSDPVIDGDDLATLVADGEARYVLWGSENGRGGGNASITSYLESSCSVVTDTSFGTSTNTTLYDCGV